MRSLFQLPLVALIVAALLAGLVDDAEARKRRRKKRVVRPSAEFVNTDLGFKPGTIVIVNRERRLYYVVAEGRSRRYRVAVGERDERWTGRTFVSMKKTNPKWFPVDGKAPVEGGSPANPLGKRAIYLDWSLLRIHGTNKRYSIGRAVSNGCIRMFNRDVIDLYARVHLGAPVVAINRRRDARKFQDKRFTGKLPSWKGQAEFWRQRDIEKRQEKLEARRTTRRRARSARIILDGRNRRRAPPVRRYTYRRSRWAY